MNSLTNIIIYFLVGLVGFLFIVWLGFRIPPKPRKPDFIPGRPALPLEGIAPRNNQQPVKDEYLVTTQQCVAWGNGQLVVGSLPVFGRLWAAHSWTLYLDPGKSFVLRSRITWFGRAILFGGDMYANGKGKFVMADTTLENENISRSEYTMLWLYSFCFALDNLRSQPVIHQVVNTDHNQLWTIEKENDRPFSFKLIFAPDLFTLLKIETQRTTSKTGTDLPFSFEINKHLTPTPSTIIPASITAVWENDPYMILSIKGFSPGVDVSAEIMSGI